ncbi:MAG: hypothetical protein PHD01_08115 [Geobacteraceae bacterium]|nr:hypothetical protein [Geobacteraceae bacterium]
MDTLLKTRTNILLLVITVLGVYYPAIFSPLNSVDDPGLYHYLLNIDEFSIRDLFIPGGSGTYYRPLLAASFFVDKYVWGLQESFMHLQNIFLHLCNTLLVFAIARRASSLMEVRSPVPSFLAPFFFAIHPINTEAVIWISARTDLLAGFFVLLSAWLMLGTTFSRMTSVLAAFSLLLACLAKETAIFFLPAALILPFFICSSDRGRKSLLSTMSKNFPHFIIFTTAALGYFVLRSLAFSKGDSGVGRVITHVAGAQTPGLLISLRLVLKAAGFYVKKLFVPFPLNFGIIHVSDLYMFLGIGLLVVIILLLKYRTLPAYFIICAISVGTSALMIPLLRLTWTPLAERYMYIPSAFFLLGITFAANRWDVLLRYRKVTVMSVASLAAICIFGTAQRTIVWQDNLALFRDTIQKSPDFLPAQNQYARALYVSGRQDEAVSLLESLKVPADIQNFQVGMVSKAAARVHASDFTGAREILQETLKNPGKYEVLIIQRLLKLNEMQVRKGMASRGDFYTENTVYLSRLYEITGDPFYLYRLGQIHLFNGDLGNARGAFCRVVALTPEKMYYRAAAEKLLKKLPE